MTLLEAPREYKRGKCGDRRQRTGLRNSDGRETRKIHVSRSNLIRLVFLFYLCVYSFTEIW